MKRQSIPNSSLTLSGERWAAISDEASQIRLLVRGGKNLTDSEAITLAVASRMTDLNPVIGEIYFVPNVGIEIGVAGARKKAKEQQRRESGNGDVYTLEFFQPGKDELDFEEGDIVFGCMLRTPQDSRAYSKTLVELMSDFGDKVDDPFEAAKEILGVSPRWVGYGRITAQEQTKLDGRGKNKMTHFDRCRKRAETAALKMRFPMGLDLDKIIDESIHVEAVIGREVENFGEHKIVDDESRTPTIDKIIEDSRKLRDRSGVLNDSDEPAIPYDAASEQDYREATADEREISEAAAENVDPDPIPPVEFDWPSNWIEILVKKNYAQNGHNAVGMLNLSLFTDPENRKHVNKNHAAVWASFYRESRDLGGDSKVSVAYADSEYLAVELKASTQDAGVRDE